MNAKNSLFVVSLGLGVLLAMVFWWQREPLSGQIPVAVPTAGLISATASPATRVTSIASSPPKIRPERLWQNLLALSSERYTPEQRQEARSFLAAELQSAGWRVVAQPFATGINLVAEQSGQSSRAGIILVGAHYDTVLGSPGADDNGSGVATVLELAHVFRGRSTPRTLRLVLFDREETGLQGSLAYTNQAANRLNLEGVVILDMLGFACHTENCQTYPNNLPIEAPRRWGDFLAVVGKLEFLPLLYSFHATPPDTTTGLVAFALSQRPGLPPVLTLGVPLRGLFAPDLLRSDHAPFWYQGIGAVLVTDTANFRSPHYHQPSDRPETLDREFFNGSAQLVVNTVHRLLDISNN